MKRTISEAELHTLKVRLLVGIGKTYLTCALAHKACRDGYSALYTRMPQLARVDVLVVDDWLIDPLQEMERRDFLEIFDDRHGQRATLLASQLPGSRPNAAMSTGSGSCLARRPACWARSRPPTSVWRRAGRPAASSSRQSGGPGCWAVRASRSR